MTKLNFPTIPLLAKCLLLYLFLLGEKNEHGHVMQSYN